MASMFMMKQMTNLRFRLGSKAQLLFPQLHRCSPSFPSNHVSRVSFTSASKFHQKSYARGDVGGDQDAKAAERMRQARQVYGDDKEDVDEMEMKYDDMKQTAKDSAQIYGDDKEDVDEMEMRYDDMKQRAKDSAQSINEKAKEGADQTSDTMHDAKERMKEGAYRAREKTKEGAEKAAEAMQNVGDKAKETAKGAWESVKDGTQKIKETVIGEDEDKYKTKPEDYIMEDHLPKYGDARDIKGS